MNTNTIPRYSPCDGPMCPTPHGDFYHASDVEVVVEGMRRRHKLEMDKLRASSFNTMGTISGRLISRGGSPSTIKKLISPGTEENPRYTAIMVDIDKKKFEEDIAKVVSYNRGKRQSDTIQFEELEL